MNDQIRAAAKTAMYERRLTQQQLATILKTSQPTLAQLLSGKRVGSPATWEKILEALDLRLEMRAISIAEEAPAPR